MKRIAILTIAVPVVLAAGWSVYYFVGGTGGPPAQSKGEIAIALEGPPTSMDPIAGSLDVHSYALVTAGHAPLSLVDGEGRIVMLIAESMAMSDDALRCEIALSPTAKFWDGSPVTATNVKYSLERVWRSSHPHAKWILSRIRGAQDADTTSLSGVEIVDDHHLVIHFAKPDPDFIAFISTGLTSIVKEGSAEHDKQPFDRSIIGCGPFEPADFSPGQEFVFVRNEGFPHGGGADRLVLRVIDNPQNRLQAFRAGQVDVVRLRGPMISEAARLTNGELDPIDRFSDAVVTSRPANELTFAVFNWTKLPLSNVPEGRRRQLLAALSAAWPRDRIARDLYLGQAQPATGVVPPLVAKDQYVWTRSSEAVPSIDAAVPLITANDPDSRRVASALQAQFSPVGMTLEPQYMDLNQLIGRMLKGDYSVGALWVEQAIPAGPIPWMMFFDPAAPFVALGQPIEGVGEAIEEARGTLDTALRAERYEAVVTRVNDQQTAFLPLLSRNVVLMSRAWVDGLFIDQNGVVYYTFLSDGGIK